MTARLTEDDLAVIESWYQGDTSKSISGTNIHRLLAEVRALREERDAAVALSRPTKHADEATTYPTPEHGWICFHCGEVFTVKGLAADHFGADPLAEPACLIKAGHERNLVATIREAEEQLARYRDEDTDKDRELHAMRADHATALRREEEAGYNRGVRDMTAERDDLQRRLDAATHVLFYLAAQ